MPRFHWAGRAADGREVKGELDAASKEDVVMRLRESGIFVSNVSTGRGAAQDPVSPVPFVESGAPGTAPPPRQFANRLARERTRRPRRLKAVLIGVAFLAGAVAIGAFLPITTYDCERSGDDVACTLRERALGLFTLREQRLAHVSAVGYDTQWFDGRDERGRPTKTSRMRLQLRDAAGATLSPTHWGQGSDALGLGATNATVDAAISNLVRDGSGPVHLRQVEWPLIVLAGPLVGLGLLMLLLTVVSLFTRPTDALYSAAGTLAARADAEVPNQDL